MRLLKKSGRFAYYKVIGANPDTFFPIEIYVTYMSIAQPLMSLLGQVLSCLPIQVKPPIEVFSESARVDT